MDDLQVSFQLVWCEKVVTMHGQCKQCKIFGILSTSFSKFLIHGAKLRTRNVMADLKCLICTLKVSFILYPVEVTDIHIKHTSLSIYMHTEPSCWKTLSVEHKWFERGVKEAIYIQAVKLSLNRDSR